jgi:hypothetical protein
MSTDQVKPDQVEVNEPFAFESGAKDSDYRLVKRVQLNNGQISSEGRIRIRRTMFDPLNGQVVLDHNTWIKIRVDPVQDHRLGTFIMFSLNSEEGKDKCPDDSFDDYSKITGYSLQPVTSYLAFPRKHTKPDWKINILDYFSLDNDEDSEDEDSMDDDSEDGDEEDVNDCKQINILASFCIVTKGVRFCCFG